MTDKPVHRRPLRPKWTQSSAWLRVRSPARLPGRSTGGLFTRVAAAAQARDRELRRRRDDGSESTDKILWAAATVMIAGTIGAVLRGKLQGAAEALGVTLGW